MPEFAQFRVTPVTLAVAVALVGGRSDVLAALASGELTEYALPTFAKLVPVRTGEIVDGRYQERVDAFGVFSYAHDGSDGRRAVEAVG